MANQYIVDYLQKNKDRFSFGVLRKKLQKAGYPVLQIEEAARLVYKEKAIPESETIGKGLAREGAVAPPPLSEWFWDFWHKKRYSTAKERLIDLAAGIVLAIALTYIIGFGVLALVKAFGFFRYSSYMLVRVFIFLALIIYFLIKRKYIGLGIICGLIINFFYGFLIAFLF